jgi:hypothetical protein
MAHDGDGTAVPIAASSSSYTPTRREIEVSDAEWAAHVAAIESLKAEAFLAIIRSASAPSDDRAARPMIANAKPHPLHRDAAPPTQSMTQAQTLPRTPEIDPWTLAPVSPLTPESSEKDTKSHDKATKVAHDPVKRLQPTPKAARGTYGKCDAPDVDEEHVNVVEEQNVDEEVTEDEQDDDDKDQAVVAHSDRIAVLLERLAFLQEEFGVCKDELKAKGAWSRHLMHHHTNNERGGQTEKEHKVLQFVRDGDLDSLFDWAESKEGVDYAKWFGWRVERYKKQGNGSKGSGSKGTGSKSKSKSKGTGSKGSGDGKSDRRHHKRGGDDTMGVGNHKRHKKNSGTQSRRY